MCLYFFIFSLLLSSLPVKRYKKSPPKSGFIPFKSFKLYSFKAITTCHATPGKGAIAKNDFTFILMQVGNAGLCSFSCDS